jgi:hypothetical protein
VAVQIGERLWNAAYGLDSPAIARLQPEAPGANRAGYELRIDTSSWDSGRHYVTVAAFDLKGQRTAVEGWIEVLPFKSPPETVRANRSALVDGGVVLMLDKPAIANRTETIDGMVEVSGWAYAEDGIETVMVTIDGRHQHEAVRAINCPGLFRDYGQEVAAEAGFASCIDRVLIPPGRHSISVVAVSAGGQTAGIERTIDVPRNSEDTEDKPDLESPGADLESEGVGLHWRDRALLAEADAAISRTECNIARTQYEHAAQELRRMQAQLAEAMGRVAVLQKEHAIDRASTDRDARSSKS